MGRRTTQIIYQCSLCEKTPEDGEYMWHMGSEIWCKDCSDLADNNPDEFNNLYGEQEQE